MKTYQKLVPVLLVVALSFGGCEGHLSKNAPQLKDTLEVMTRPTESAAEVKIYKSGGNLREMAPGPPLTTVFVHEMKGYGQDTVFGRQAAALLEKVINSLDFKYTMIHNSYGEDNGNSAEQIYDLIMKAHEPVGAGGNDQVMDLYLRVVSLAEDGEEWMRNCEPGSSMGTIGIDGAGTGIAAVCPQWLRSTAQQKKPSWLAAHFIHEYMHVLGFRHRFRKSRSVPYKIQSIVESLGAQYDPQ